MVFIEKMTDRLIGSSLLPMLRTDFGKEGAGNDGWILHIEEATRKDVSIAWIRTVIASTQRAVQSHSGALVDPASLDNVETPPGRSTLFHGEGSLTVQSIRQAGFIAGAKRHKKEGRRAVFFAALEPREQRARRGVSGFIRDHERFTSKAGGKSPEDAIYWINLGEKHKIKD